MGTAPWSSVKQNEGIGGIGPEIGQCCSSSSAGSQPGTVYFSRMAKIASATPSAATSRSSPSDSTVSTSRRRGALHGAAIASSALTLGARGLGGAERTMSCVLADGMIRFIAAPTQDAERRCRARGVRTQSSQSSRRARGQCATLNYMLLGQIALVLARGNRTIIAHYRSYRELSRHDHDLVSLAQGNALSAQYTECVPSAY